MYDITTSFFVNYPLTQYYIQGNIDILKDVILIYVSSIAILISIDATEKLVFLVLNELVSFEFFSFCTFCFART